MADQTYEAAPAHHEIGSDKLVRRLSMVVLLEWMGAGIVLPLLPIYLRDHGISTGFVGVTMAAFYFAGLCFQYPAGHFVDRIGKRPILIGGLVLYGMASLAYLLPSSAWLFFLLRFLQGAAAGAVEVAALALVSSAIPLEARGQATSKIYSGMFIGIFVGPVFGAAVGVSHMGLLFVATAVICSVAAIPVITSSAIKAHDKVHLPESGVLESVTVDRAMVGAMLIGSTLGLATGVYEACWSMLMQSQGASQLQIGLSWAVFSLPYIFLVRLTGWMTDHWDRRIMAAGGIMLSMGLFLLWPHLHSPNLMIGLNIFEAVAYSLILPSAQSMLTGGRSDEVMGRIQGIYATANTATITVSAVTAGFLFGLGHWIPFTLSAPIGVAAAIVALILWRGVPGRVADIPTGPNGSTTSSASTT
jgi:MFS family permease